MLMRAIVLAFSCATSSLTLTAPVSRPAPQQTEEQRVGDTKQVSAETPVQGESAKEKIADDVKPDSTSPLSRGIKGLGKEFLMDQKQIWTSPAKIRPADTQWLVPMSGIAAGLFVTDSGFSGHLSKNQTTISHYKTLSNAGVGALIGGAGGMWLLGRVNHNEHWSETGFLAGEAALNSLVAVEAFKYSLGRQRPYQGDGSGPFFQSGGTSFPSEHAAAAWSVAGVLAHEYPGPLMKIAAYGLASLVDYSRIRGRQHFPSDVFVGSIVGNLVAQNVYSRHHDPDLGGEAWKSISQMFRGDGTSSPANQGSPSVPLDSWIYPALDRLAGMGLINSAFEGMKPWTRNECARLLQEASDSVDGQGHGGREAEEIYRLLEEEFHDELESGGGAFPIHAKIESLYARVTGISGEPLTDGNHFGQTLINDFGRPYQEGFNSVDGFSAWTTAGHWVGYVRGEYQHAPSGPSLSANALQFINSVDGTPTVSPGTRIPASDRFRLLDAYVGLNFENWQVSFGKQSLWWGPMAGGPLMFSNNAAPINMFRISRVSPFKLPSVAGLLGPIRVEWFLGQFEGHQFVFQTGTGLVGQLGQSLSRQPFLQGQKISLKPTPNFEFSVSLTVVFAGGPSPLTFHTFTHSYSLGQGVRGAPDASDPGDRRSGADFSYRVPGLRNWLTFYGEAFNEDEFSPVAYPRKAAILGGLYLSHVPGLAKLDLRVEGGTTVPPDFPGCNGCFYVNDRYPGGSYANLGNLVGNWLGRAGQGEQAWSTYWLTSRNKIQFNYRHQKISTAYLPQGGTLNDGGMKADFWLGTKMTLSGSVQYEKWNYPVLDPLPRSNVTTSIQFTFWPRSWK
jgi:membrane-associated phospholipid phosphatase